MINESLLLILLISSSDDNIPEKVREKIQKITEEAYLIQDVDNKLDKLRCILIELNVEVEKATLKENYGTVKHIS